MKVHRAVRVDGVNPFASRLQQLHQHVLPDNLAGSRQPGQRGVCQLLVIR